MFADCKKRFETDRDHPYFMAIPANFAASKSSMPSPAMTYDDVFPVLPEVATISNRPEQAIGKWNNKLRVGPRNVTQVIFESSSKNVALKSI